MTRKDAIEALVAKCEGPENARNLAAMQWMLSVIAATENHEDNTIRDWARLFMDGVPASRNMTAREVANDLFHADDEFDEPQEEIDLVAEVQQQVDEFLRDYVGE